MAALANVLPRDERVSGDFIVANPFSKVMAQEAGSWALISSGQTNGAAAGDALCASSKQRVKNRDLFRADEWHDQADTHVLKSRRAGQCRDAENLKWGGVR